VLVTLISSLEDAVRDQQPENPIEPARIGPAPGRELLDAHRILVDIVGYTKFGDDMQGPRRHDCVR
jgi:hypothetical protein